MVSLAVTVPNSKVNVRSRYTHKGGGVIRPRQSQKGNPNTESQSPNRTQSAILSSHGHQSRTTLLAQVTPKRTLATLSRTSPTSSWYIRSPNSVPIGTWRVHDRGRIAYEQFSDGLFRPLDSQSEGKGAQEGKRGTLGRSGTTAHSSPLPPSLVHRSV